MKGDPNIIDYGNGWVSPSNKTKGSQRLLRTLGYFEVNLCGESMLHI